MQVRDDDLKIVRKGVIKDSIPDKNTVQLCNTDVRKYARILHKIELDAVSGILVKKESRKAR